jgi:hypothetical protein
MCVNIKRRVGRLFVLVVSATMLAGACNQALADHDDVPAGLPVLTDDGCQTACGPITCFVAARSLGVDVSLDAMIQKCDWKQGQLTTLQRIQETLAGLENEIVSVPARVSPKELQEYLQSGNYVAVLPVRKRSEEVNHAICAVGLEDDKIIAIDYPELTERYTLDELADIWDGPALLVSRSSQGWAVRNLHWLVLPILAALLVMADLILRKVRVASRSGASPPAEGRGRFFTFLFGLLPFALLSLMGCEMKGSPGRQPADENPQLGGASSRIGSDGSVGQNAAVIFRHDFEAVRQGEVVEHEFTIKNDEAKEVEYTQFHSGCGCLSIADNPGVISVNGKGTIAVKMDTGGLQGRVTQRAALRSADANVRPVVLTLTGTVVGVEASRSTIDLGDLKTGSPVSRSFLLIAAGYPDAEVTSATAEDAGIHITTEDIASGAGDLGKGRRAFCRVTVEWNGQGLPPGAFESSIAVTTNVSEFSSIVVPVVGYVIGAVELSPTRVFFGNVAAGTQARRSCKLVDGQLSWAEMESLHLKADHDFVHGTFSRETGSETGHIRLGVELDVPAEAENGLIKGDLLVSMKDGEYFFCVPYVALIR